MGKQLNTFIDFKHSPADCPRQRAVSRFLQTEEDFPEDGDDKEVDDFYDEDGNIINDCNNNTNFAE